MLQIAGALLYTQNFLMLQKHDGLITVNSDFEQFSTINLQDVNIKLV